LKAKDVSDKLQNTIPIVAVTISFVALLASLVALYFTWQSNEIARASISPKVTTLELASLSSGAMPSTSDGGEARGLCSARFVVSNMGGAATGIVEQRLDIVLGDDRYYHHITSGGMYTRENVSPPFMNELTANVGSRTNAGFDILDNRLVENSFWEPLDLVELPISLSANSALAITTALRYSFGPSVELWSSDGKELLFGVDSIAENQTSSKDLSFVITYVLSSGEEISSEPVQCGSLVHRLN